MSAILLAVAIGACLGAQETAPVAGDVENLFPPGDHLRDVVVPIEIGMDGFAARLDAIRAQGRQPLGLVLAGGSARAYAHIGVLDVLEKNGYKPDYIVANSMGAVIGILYSAGLSPSMIATLVETLPTELFLDLVLPTKGGFINVDPFTALARKLIGDKDLLQLEIPVIVTAEDLKSRRQVIFAAGEFSRVMSTSFAIPSIFEPISFDDYLLIDGGVTNLVPVEIAARYSDKLIVSTTLYDRDVTYDNFIAVITRAFDLVHTREGMKYLLETRPFVIRNDVERVLHMQYSSPAGIIEAGRISALAALPALRDAMPPSGGNGGTGIPDSLAQARERISGSLDRLISEFSRGALPDVRPSLRFKLNISLADKYERQVFGLGGEAFVGLGASFSSGRFRAGVSAGLGLSSSPGKAWSSAVSLVYNPVDALKASAEFRLWGDFASWPAFFLDPETAEARFGVDWQSPGELVRFHPYLRGALYTPFYSPSLTWEARTGIGASLARRPAAAASGALSPIARLEGGYFADSLAGSLRYGPEWIVAAGLSLEGAGALRARTSGRYDASGAGLALRYEDAYRGSAPSGTAPLVSVLNLDLAWYAKPLEFSLGEVLHFRDIELGPYADLAWAGSSLAGASPTATAFGMHLEFTASFAGLKPFDTSVFCGVNQDMVPVVGIRADRLFKTAQ